MRKVQGRLPAAASRSTGNSGRVVKMRLAASISTANPVNCLLPGAAQCTDPRKPDVSAETGNAWSMNQDVCPLASRGISTSSSTTPPLINRQLTSIASSSRLWRAAAVRIPPACWRAGKRASLMGGLAPTTASPMPGRAKRSIVPTERKRPPSPIRSPDRRARGSRS